MTGPSAWFTGTVTSMHGRDARGRLLAPEREQRPLHARALARPGTPTPTAKPSTSPTASACASDAPVPSRRFRLGDRVFFEPDEEHWHGAAPTHFMTHLAMLQVDEQGKSATWGEHVSDVEYNTPRPPISTLPSVRSPRN